MENLESRDLSYVIIGEFLSDLKEKFGSWDNETMKVAELKKVKQENKTIKNFMQEFRRAARGSRYKERTLIEEFKREMNGVIRRKLIEVKCPPKSIKKSNEFGQILEGE